MTKTPAAPAAGSTENFWRATARSFRKNRLAMLGLILVAFLFLVALFADLLAGEKPLLMKKGGEFYAPLFFSNPDFLHADFREVVADLEKGEWALVPPVRFSPTATDLEHRLSPPSRRHFLGADALGRDVLSRLIHGTRISLSVGFVVVSIYVVIGIFLGSLAGYYGGKVDLVISRVIEIVICFPVFFLILAVLAFLAPSIFNIMIVLGIFGWPGVARLVRAEVLKVKTYDFVTASRALGARPAHIIVKHIIPNTLAPVLVSATFGVAGAILTESALSFLGFGVQPPTPSWGELLSQSQKFVDFAWWLVIFPGLAIFLTVTAYNLVGEGLRDAIDPRLRS